MSLIESVVPKLEGLRTLVVYDSPVTARILILRHILPHYSNKNIYLAIYSESMCRKARKSYESIIKTHPESANLLNKVKIIKIGFNEEVPFGELHQFINIEEQWCEKLADILMDFSSKDIIIFHGFSLVQLLYSKDWLVRNLKFFDRIPSDITVINKISKNFYRGWVEGVLRKLHDVVIRAEKSERGLLDHEESYLIGVEESTVIDIPLSSARFKLSETGVFEEC